MRGEIPSYPGSGGFEHRLVSTLVESVVGPFVGELLVRPAEKSVVILSSPRLSCSI